MLKPEKNQQWEDFYNTVEAPPKITQYFFKFSKEITHLNTFEHC